jgi:hypothetical protein
MGAGEPARRVTSTALEPPAGEEFVAFFAAGWSIGASDPERFFAHFDGRLRADARLVQPLAPELRGTAGLRELLTPLFDALPDLRGEVVRWGPTEDGVIVELVLHSPATGIAWPTLDVIELRAGRIAGRRAHFDPLPLMGALLRRPRVLLRLLRHRLPRRRGGTPR